MIQASRARYVDDIIDVEDKEIIESIRLFPKFVAVEPNRAINLTSVI